MWGTTFLVRYSVEGILSCVGSTCGLGCLEGLLCVPVCPWQKSFEKVGCSYTTKMASDWSDRASFSMCLSVRFAKLGHWPALVEKLVSTPLW